MTVTVKSDGREYEYYSDEEILASEIFEKLNINFPKPCGGNGKCGKCSVLVNGKSCLACSTVIKTDCMIEVPLSSDISGVTDFSNHSYYYPLTGDKDCYAAVIDIGTTTIASYLYKMPECKLVKTDLRKNNQSVFGVDVMSRITADINGSGEELNKIIQSEVTDIIKSFGVECEMTVFTGNTAMLHFLKGISTESLSHTPYEAKEQFGTAGDRECILRCISGFAGADVLCGIISSGMLENEKSILIDVGTNGEIVYKNGNKIKCCSSAAGSAFEGYGLSNGVQAVDGAINKVYNVGSGLYYTTINNSKAVGICGSGIIDAISSMLRAEIIDTSGYLESEYIIGDSEVSISPEDIRAYQTAKAAIRGALETICDDLNSVEKFYLAGSFGKYIDIDNAVLTGLFPKCMKEKTVFCGNTAAGGAVMALFDRRNIDRMNLIADKIETVQLGGSQTFFEKYIENINF